MERSMAAETVLRLRSEYFRAPLDKAGGVSLGQHHALRRSRRAGRIQEISEIILVPPGHGTGGRMAEHIVLTCRDHGFKPFPNVPPVWVQEHGPHCAVAQNRPDARGRRRPIHRHIRGPHLHRPEHRAQCCGTLRKNNAYTIAGLDASRRQHARDAVRALIQFGVGQFRTVRIHDGHPVRPAPRGIFKVAG